MEQVRADDEGIMKDNEEQGSSFCRQEATGRVW